MQASHAQTRQSATADHRPYQAMPRKARLYPASCIFVTGLLPNGKMQIQTREARSAMGDKSEREAAQKWAAGLLRRGPEIAHAWAHVHAPVEHD